MKLHLLALLLATSAFAAEPPSMVTIKAQIIETDPKTGKEDVMSAPTLATQHDKTATFSVGSEVVLAPFGDEKALRQTIETGVHLTITPQVRAGDIVLVGRATVREPDGKTDDGSALLFKTREMIFVAEVADGGQHEIKLGPVDGRALTVRLTAAKKEMKNAAVTYWQAFAALPQLDEAQRKLIAPPSAEPTAAARALVEQAKGALDLLGKASGDDYCAWDLDLTQGPELKLPHIAPAQTLARLALLRARLRAADGDQAGALADRLAALRLSVDVSRPALLICRLVGIAIETPTLNALAAQLPTLDDGQRARVASSLGLIERAPTMPECLAAEGDTMSAWMLAQLDAKAQAAGGKFDPGEWLGGLLAPMTSDGKSPVARAKASELSADDVRKMIAGYRAGMAELAKLDELPFEQFKAAAASFFERIKADAANNPILAVSAPALDKVRVGELQAQTRLALLRAALEVQAKGEAALPAALATYRKTERGFELTSKAQFDGKPVVLTVGL